MKIDFAIWRRLLLRWFTSAGNRVAVAVGAGAGNVAVTWARTEPNTEYGVHATPSWGTTVYVTNKLAAGCTLNFGTGAPVGGGTVDVSTFRSED
jgi:hypothetical protein